MYEAATTASIPLSTRKNARKTGSMISTLLPIFTKRKKVLRFLTRLIILYIAQHYVLMGGVETCASALYTPSHTELRKALHADV